MGIMNVDQNIHFVPLRVTTTDTATFSSKCINMKLYEKVQFIIHFGTVGGTNALTVAQSTGTTMAGATAIAARYRLSAAAGTDTMGATTALESTGLTLTYGSYTLLTLIVDVDSSDMINESAPYVGLTFTGTGSMVNTLFALCWPKYPKETNASALT